MNGLVCSICGSSNIEASSIQPSLGDPSHPLGLCWNCRPANERPGRVNSIKSTLSPLMSADEWQGKLSRRRIQAAAEDLWGGLPAEEYAALRTPVR